MLRDHTGNTVFLPSRRVFLACLGGAPLLAAGCGAQNYDSRIKETKAFYEYLERVSLAITPKPLRVEGVEIRVPLQFEHLAPQAIPAQGQSEPPPLEPDADPRRLGYCPDVMLEGVLASWKGNVRVDGPGSSDAGEAHAYLHLLSNLERWIAKQTDNEVEPLNYLKDLSNQLAMPEAFNVVADTPDEPWEWDPIKGFAPYVSRKKVESIHIPVQATNTHPPLEAVLYRFEVKDIQIGLLLVVPQAIDPREKLEERLKHTLETMKVPTQPPQRKSNQPAAGF